ncbi:DUF6607 family protein [Maricaulis salignorans]|uniref:Uncharacterized protein n=1 Tax=Maricaulis salignorans TaxID=144026 RepID=A0A1G9N105_9PROT|nr:DUF6607 family protein [Maricaulis salignorans]SDL80222.1 hypothetical protein SAMN04488568_102181 [Maricaulis salignorans]
MKTLILAAAALALTGCASTTHHPAAAYTAPASEVADVAAFERDRQAILAMQGEYAVTFDFRETVAIAPGYQLAEPKLTPARELVIVIEDSGDFIMLQHLLLAGDGPEPFIVKHWRQDWRYEPARVLAFEGHDDWRMDDVAAADRSGAWSQTVYQVDDSPRYAAVGQWVHTSEASTWEPPVSWRPLPRRDDTTREDYDVIAAVNRHTVTPWGWTHEQDNSKLVVREGVTEELVREIGVNTYRRTELEGAAAAHAYWDATEDYWVHVRDRFLELERSARRFHIEDDAEGTLLYGPVLDAGQRVLFGMDDVDAAWADAQTYLDSQITVLD